ncbi:hypothetical protein DL96DRAFT_1603882 [Flagelloscypha sp. PMI_526]|nr:hypothetical protein DL96DRAFT_1603882 [Flagelloscypha sp. PMI_526]
MTEQSTYHSDRLRNLHKNPRQVLDLARTNIDDLRLLSLHWRDVCHLPRLIPLGVITVLGSHLDPHRVPWDSPPQIYLNEHPSSQFSIEAFKAFTHIIDFPEPLCMQYPSTRVALTPILPGVVAWLTFFFNSPAGKLEENIQEISFFWKAVWLLDKNDIPDEKARNRKKKLGFHLSKLPGSLPLLIRIWTWENIHFTPRAPADIRRSHIFEATNLCHLLAFRQWDEEIILNILGASPARMAKILMSRISYSDHPDITIDQFSLDLELLQYFIEAREEDANLPDFQFGKPCPNIRRALVQQGAIKPIVVGLLNCPRYRATSSAADNLTSTEMKVDHVRITLNVLRYLLTTGDAVTSVRQALKMGLIEAFAACIPYIHCLEQEYQDKFRELVFAYISPFLHLPSLRTPFRRAIQSFQTKTSDFWKSWETIYGMDTKSVASWRAIILSFGQTASEIKAILALDGPSFHQGVARCCYNPKCRAEGSGVTLKCCSYCRRALYCTKTCQRAEWATHKTSGCLKIPESARGYFLLRQ